MKKILLIFLSFNFALSQEYLIKVATIAPDGSTWINVLREYDAQIRKESNGRIGFKIYAGGVAGDEIDVLKKI
ncbi:MAG: TRAP transporter substrate-binding protein DctP, partial [Candidatus Kryptonium sp.]